MLMRSPESLNNDFTAIKRKIDSDYTANQAVWQIYWTEGTIDTRLEAGDTSLMADINASLPNNNRGQWYFNRVRPLCNMVSGTQRRNRKSTIVVPLENGDNKTADQWTKILLNIYKRENVNEIISEAFHQGACITGMNLLQVYIDWKNDPISGDIKVDNLPYNCFFIDPYFRKPDLSDCQFIWRRTYMSHSAAAALMPNHRDEIMDLPGNPTGTGRDGRFQYMAESYGQTQQNRLAYDEYWYRDYRKQKLLVDKVTGEVFEVTDQDNLDVKTFLQHHPQVTMIDQEVPTVSLAIMIQDKVFYNGRNPLNIDNFPFVGVFGYYNSMMPYFYSRIQGICRSLRDPQMLLNRRIILSADLIESVANSGFIFKENAVVDVKHLFQTGQGRIIPLKDDAQMTDIVQIQPPQIPPSFFQMQETFSKELNFVSGITEENMGQVVSTDQSSGYKEALRQGAGLTTLQPIFDRLDTSCKILGERMMEVAQKNYTPGKIKNLLEGEEPAPLFYNKAFGKYHCMVELGFDTESQQQMQFAQYVELKKLGVNISDARMIQAATIQKKDDWIKELEEQSKQAAQQQQMQMQVQMQEMQSRSEGMKAKAAADMGLYAERTSRVAENIEMAKERKAAAEKDKDIALLNLIKAAKELQSMDIDYLAKIMSIKNEREAHEFTLNNDQQEGPVE